MTPEPRWSDPDNVREYAGWTGRETEVPGVRSRIYTHPQYAGWEIYENDPHGFAAIYHHGTKVENCDAVAAAVGIMTDVVVPDNRRVDLDGKPGPAVTFLDPSSVTWTCMVCGVERPDAFISVRRREVEHNGKIVPGVPYNQRYCNDRPDCTAYASTPGPYRIEKLPPVSLEKQREYRDWACELFDVPAWMVPIDGEPKPPAIPPYRATVIPQPSARRFRATRPWTWFRR